jgi:hypothetical protein
MIDEKFLKLVRAQIAAENFQKKSLARKCKVTRPQFSEMIHGDRIIPPKVRERLISELELEVHVERLGL